VILVNLHQSQVKTSNLESTISYLFLSIISGAVLIGYQVYTASAYSSSELTLELTKKKENLLPYFLAVMVLLKLGAAPLSF